MKSFSKLVGAAVLVATPLISTSLSSGAAIVNLTLTVNQTADTWSAYEYNSGTTAQSGLAGLTFNVTGGGGAVVTSSKLSLVQGSDDDLGATGFVSFRSNGSAGVGLAAYQSNVYTVNSYGDATNVFLNVGNQAETINTGDSGGTPTDKSVADPVLIATGVYTGSGSLTISALTTQTTLLPSPIPAATTSGTNYSTFSPDSINGQTVAVGAVPEPTSLALLSLGGLAALKRRHKA